MKIVKNNYYKVDQFFEEKYFKLPQVFFTSAKYKDMLLEAKVAYALLKDRFKYSVKNNWFDEEGNIYFIYTNNELMAMLNCKKEKLSKIKKTLEKYGLLFQKRQGLNKPNMLYLLRPEVTAQDVYNLTKDGSSLLPQGSSKIELPENNGSSLLPQGSSKIEHNQYYSLENTKKTQEDTHLDFLQNNYTQQEIDTQNRDLIKHSSEYYTDTDHNDKFVLNKEAMNVLSMWCRTPEELHRAIQIILNAKRSAIRELEQEGLNNAQYILLINGNAPMSDLEKDDLADMGINVDELPNRITNTLRKVLNRIRRLADYGKNVNTENYLFGSFKTMFKEYADEKEIEIVRELNSRKEG